eukprot:1142563-Pelagomonas_calceolata.AAC.5
MPSLLLHCAGTCRLQGRGSCEALGAHGREIGSCKALRAHRAWRQSEHGLTDTQRALGLVGQSESSGSCRAFKEHRVLKGIQSA